MEQVLELMQRHTVGLPIGTNYSRRVQWGIFSVTRESSILTDLYDNGTLLAHTFEKPTGASGLGLSPRTAFSSIFSALPFLLSVSSLVVTRGVSSSQCHILPYFLRPEIHINWANWDSHHLPTLKSIIATKGMKGAIGLVWISCSNNGTCFHRNHTDFIKETKHCWEEKGSHMLSECGALIQSKCFHGLFYFSHHLYGSL